MEQKHFMDIQHIREEDTELRERNTKAFYPGCVISITEKYDGSCFCVAWDDETQELKCFSRKKELNFQNTLNGFWNFVQTFPVEKMLFKLRDEGVLPEKIQPTDFKIVAQNLPKAVWDDIMKEEKELVMQCGEYGGKMCQGIAMSIARDILLGT